MEPQQTESDRNDAIQLAAYYLWEQRGSPFGTPDVDWFLAEEQLHKHTEELPSKPAMVAVAEAMGSALGSIAGFVTSVGGPVRSEETSGSE